MNDIKYATMIPLIGGESIGIMNAMGGQLPEYVLTYEAFGANDSHYINYLRDKKDWTGEYHVIDGKDAVIPNLEESVDFVNSVCPCAGLSGLSASSHADSATNDWMYTSSEYVLEHVKPKVLWGENAPALATNKGRKVANALKDIGTKYGYSFLLIKTSSRLHGNPQKRARTFYFFFKEDYVPHLNIPTRDTKSYSELISEVTIDSDDPMSMLIHAKADKPTDDPYLKYLLHAHQMSYPDYCKSVNDTETVLALIEETPGGFPAASEWLAANDYEKQSKRCAAIQKKLDDDKNYWAYSTTIMGHFTGAFVGAAPQAWTHPTEDRYLTYREGLHIMGMPDDFELLNPKKNTNHICQNVPVNTAEDMTHGILDYLKGKYDNTTSDYVVHDLHNNKSESRTVIPAPQVSEFF